MGLAAFATLLAILAARRDEGEPGCVYEADDVPECTGPEVDA